MSSEPKVVCGTKADMPSGAGDRGCHSAARSKFRESCLFLAELHWEHEPGAAGRARSPLRADGGQGTGRPTKSRFMGSVDIQRFNAHWDHEPCTLPLTRPRSRGGTLSRPTGEGRGEGLRFMGKGAQ